MGYVPAAVSDGTLHRFAFQTDDEGFRNARVRERIDVAALGDSFTDAMTLAIDEAWPTRLERRTGLAVQNYGTAGFGPQQELLALKDYAAAIIRASWSSPTSPATICSTPKRSTSSRDRAARCAAPCRAGRSRMSSAAPTPGSSSARCARPARGCRNSSGPKRAPTPDARAGRRRREPDRRRGGAPGDGVAFDRGMFTASVNGRPVAVGVHAAVPQHADVVGARSRGAPRMDVDATGDRRDAGRLARHRRDVRRDVPAVQEPGLPAVAGAGAASNELSRAAVLPARQSRRAGRGADAAQPPRAEPADAAVLRRARHSVARHHRRADRAVHQPARTSTFPTSRT